MDRYPPVDLFLHCFALFHILSKSMRSKEESFPLFVSRGEFRPFLLWKAETPSHTHTRARAHATENSHVSYVFFLMAELSSFPWIDPFPFPSPRLFHVV